MNLFERKSRSEYPVRSDGEKEDMRYYAFFDQPTPENLSANRSGVITQQQHEALQRSIADQKSSITIWTSMLIVTALILCFFFWIIDGKDGIVSIKAQLLNAGVILLLLGAFVSLFIKDWYIFFMGDDLENRAVHSSRGRVEWTGNRYQMLADSQALRSLHFRVALPPPGAYRFYYLPHTGLVILAEETTANEPESPEKALLNALAQSNNFTPADLGQNRDGRLGRHQENRLLIVLALYLLGLPIGAILFFSLRMQIERALSPTATIMLMIVFAFLFLRFCWSALKIVADIWNGRVKSLEGMVELDIHRSRYSDSYYYVMDTIRFQISRAAYNALVEGKPYRVFYVPYSRRLVSIEPILDVHKDG